MDLDKTIKSLGKLASKSKSEKYFGDQTEYEFRKHVLILLRELVVNIKEIPKQQRYLWQTLDELKEMELIKKK